MDGVLLGNCSWVSFTSIAPACTFKGLPPERSFQDHSGWVIIKSLRSGTFAEKELFGHFSFKLHIFGMLTTANLSEQGNWRSSASVSSTQLSLRDPANSSPSGEIGLGCTLEGAYNSATLASLLRRCGKEKDLREGKRLHADISEHGYDRGTFLGNCLVQMYGNCGCVKDAQVAFDRISHPNLYSWNILINVHVQNGNLHEAENIFSSMPQRDVVSWNAMITALAHSSRGKQALELSRQMQVKGVKPDRVTFICLLDACASMAAIEEGQEIHAAVVKSGYEQETVLGNILINMYGRFGKLDKARAIFGCMLQQNVATWNAMITAYVKNGHEKHALELFRHMQSEGIEGDRITFLCALDACASLAVLEEGQKLHSAIVGSEHEVDVSVQNGLIYMYGKCRSLCNARAVFNRMSYRNVISWSAIISACSQSGLPRNALELFYEMQHQQVQPDKITFISVLDACASLAALREGQQIHVMIVDIGYEYDVVVGNSLVNLYGKCGSMDNARSMFYRMPRWDLFSWSSMIGASTQNGNDKDALDFFYEMQMADMNPDKIAFVCVLESCTNLTALEEGLKVHAEVVGSGHDQDLVVATALINMYGKCGHLDDAKVMLCRISRRDVICWSALMASCAQNGHGKESLELFLQMQLEGIKPDEITFLSILTACSHTGAVDHGRHFFVSMFQDYHIIPTVDHYICMIDLLSRAGHLVEAEHLIRKMPFEGVFMAWLTLLGACRTHADMQRAIHVANQCFKLDPENASPYVVLSYIYATAGMWDNVAQLREMQQNSGVENQPECSCIAVNEVVHELIGGISHPQDREIYAELNSLNQGTKGAKLV